MKTLEAPTIQYPPIANRKIVNQEPEFHSSTPNIKPAKVEKTTLIAKRALVIARKLEKNDGLATEVLKEFNFKKDYFLFARKDTKKILY